MKGFVQDLVSPDDLLSAEVGIQGEEHLDDWGGAIFDALGYGTHLDGWLLS